MKIESRHWRLNQGIIEELIKAWKSESMHWRVNQGIIEKLIAINQGMEEWINALKSESM